MNRSWRALGVLVPLGVLLGLLAWRAPRFFQAGQVLSVLTAAAPVLLVAAGVSLVIITRQIDVSLGSQFGWCSVCSGLAAAHGWPLPAVAAVALGLGLLFGAVNGALVAGLELPSIVVTLGTLVTGREALRWWREGEFVRDLPESFQWFGLSQAAGQGAILTFAGLLFACLVLAARQLALGRHFYAVGSSEEAARLAGLRPRVVTWQAFLFAGGLTGIAALLNAVRFTDVDPKTGQGLELQAIAAAVVGGISITGGRGGLWGVLPGVLLLALIAPALVFLHIPPQWERALQGMIILAAVAAEARRK